MPHPLEAGTIRIFRPNGSTAGTGFLVSKRLAITCAHVITSAKAKPGDVIRFKFHLGDLESQEAKVLEDGWSTENDVAILELIEKLPKWIRPIIMQSSRAMEGRSFEGLGYPKDGPVNARWPQGNIGGQVSIEKEYALPVLQIQGTEIDQGLSGSAIVDRTTRRVIGMISAYRDVSRPRSAPNMRFGYAIPIETIWKVYPELEKELPPLPKRSPLVEGIHLLPNGYDFRIQNFLSEYLGSPEQPEPFGGREDALKALDDWLDGDTQRLVLAAPAGRGKSALLVRWLDRLIAREDLALVFVPVSVRFRTNLASTFFASLAARLAHLHGEDVPTSEMTSTDVWRGLVNAYLTKPLTDDRKFLVVLDGLDEAGDWDATADLIPSELPKNVCVVVSARFLAGDADVKPWLLRLGWERTGRASSLELPPLDSYGVADVLLHTGIPLDVLSRRLDIVTELHRLSEGDPLLINLYVEDLWSRGQEASKLQPEDMRNIKPGYEGYFDRWWNEQKKLWGNEKPWLLEHVKDVRKILVGAMGTLTAGDIGDLAESKLGTDEVEDSINILKRFVIGIPSERKAKEVGYVLTHSKLRDYFWERLSKREQIEVEHLYIVWGETILDKTVNGDINPKDIEQIPAYIILYYCAHLIRAKQPIEKYLPLIHHHQWAHAWFTLEGSYGGYLQDVRHVWGQCQIFDRQSVEKNGNAPYLGKQIRCALIESSLHSLAENIKPELIGLLKRDRIWTMPQIWVFIKHMPDSRQQANSILALLPYLKEEQLPEAILATQVIQDELMRVKVLKVLAQNIPETMFEQALEVARAISTKRERAKALIALAQRLPELENEAFAVIQEIRNDFEYFDILTCLAQLNASKFTNEVFRAVQAMDDDQLRARILPELARQLSKSEFNHILEIARAINIENEKARVLVDLAQLFPEIRTEALEAVRNINYDIIPFYWWEGLSQWLPIVASRDLIKEVRMIQDEQVRAHLLGILAQRFPELSEEAVDTVKAIDKEFERHNLFIGLTQNLPKNKLRLVLEAVRIINDERKCVEVNSSLEISDGSLKNLHSSYERDYHQEVLISLAQNMLDDELDQILDSTRAIKDDWARARVLEALAERMPEDVLDCLLEKQQAVRYGGYGVLEAVARHLSTDKLDQVLDAIRIIKDEFTPAGVLTTLAERMPEDALNQILKETRAIRDERWRIPVLIALARRLPEITQEALEATQIIEDENEFGYILHDLIPYLAKDQLAQVMESVLKFKEQKYGSGSYVLMELASHLPESELGKLINITKLISNTEERIKILSALAQRVPELSEEVLETVRLINGDKILYTHTLITVAQRLPELAHEALRAARAIGYEEISGRELTDLATRLQENEMEQMLEVVQTLENESDRGYVLINLIQRMPDGRLGKILEMVPSFSDQEERTKILCALAKRFPKNKVVQLLEAARGIQNEWELSHVLTDLAQSFPENKLEQLLEVARGIHNLAARVEILTVLAQRLPELIGEVFDELWNVSDEDDRAYVLMEMVKFFPESKLEQVLEAARRIQDEKKRAEVLCALVPRFPKAINDVLEICRTFTDNQDSFDMLEKVNMLISFAECLPEEKLFYVLEAARRINNKSDQAKVLIALGQRMPQAIMEALKVTLSINNKDGRTSMLIDLAQYSSEAIGGALDGALAETARHEDESDADARQILLKELVRPLLNCAVVECYLLLESSLSKLSLFTRSSLFSDISAFLPVLVRVGGEGVSNEIFQSITDVNKWWGYSYHAAST